MKKRTKVEISELDVKPISDEELAALAAASEDEVDAGSLCGCIVRQSDINFC